MKKNPVLLGLIIVVGLVVGFIVVVLIFSHPGTQKPSLVLGDKIGIVEIKGVIVASEKIIDQLIAYREDSGIKAIVLRIDSPG